MSGPSGAASQVSAVAVPPEEADQEGHGAAELSPALPVLKAGVPCGRLSRSSTPRMAARAAPVTPSKISHTAPDAHRPGEALPRQSKTKAQTPSTDRNCHQSGFAVHQLTAGFVDLVGMRESGQPPRGGSAARQ